MRSKLLWTLGSVLLTLGLLLQRTATGQQPEEPVAAEQDPRFQEFTEAMQNVKLIGSFTIVGKDRPPSSEEYTIRSVKKLPQGDYWMFDARIRYGERDVTLPLPLEVKWADRTPVITLTDLTIPGLGTFSSYVVIDRDKYAGTWTHGDVSGHLYGVIEKQDPPEADAPPR